MLLEQEGRRVIDDSMSIIQVSAPIDFDVLTSGDCIYLPEINEPHGCKPWTEFITQSPLIHTVIFGGFHKSRKPLPHIDNNIFECMSRLTEDSGYSLEANISIAAVDDMDTKVLYTATNLCIPII